VPGFHVAKPRDVDAVGTIAKRHFVFVPGHHAAGAAAHVMIHEIVAELAARIGQAVGKLGSRRIKKDARGFERGSAEEEDAGFELESGFGLRVDDADTRDLPRIRIEYKAVNHAVGADG
jgi:hypothetical protein